MYVSENVSPHQPGAAPYIHTPHQPGATPYIHTPHF